MKKDKTMSKVEIFGEVLGYTFMVGIAIPIVIIMWRIALV